MVDVALGLHRFVSNVVAQHKRSVSAANDICSKALGPQCNTIPNHRAYCIARLAGNKRVEAPRTHHVPCRHLSAVFVALVPVGLVAVHRLEDLTDPLVPFVGTFSRRVQPCNVVRRLVSVGVLPNQARDVGLFATHCG